MVLLLLLPVDAPMILCGVRVCMLLMSMHTPSLCSWQMGKVLPNTRGLSTSCFTCPQETVHQHAVRSSKHKKQQAK